MLISCVPLPSLPTVMLPRSPRWRGSLVGQSAGASAGVEVATGARDVLRTAVALLVNVRAVIARLHAFDR